LVLVFLLFFKWFFLSVFLPPLDDEDNTITSLDLLLADAGAADAGAADAGAADAGGEDDEITMGDDPNRMGDELNRMGD